MRLIDADKIDFNEIVQGKTGFEEYIRERARTVILLQPTVYDVDRVVEQLKEERENAWDLCDGGARYSAYDNALEIVKSGGME